MNERIRELAKQADIKFESHPQHQGIDTAVIIPTDLAKFAELIVKECITLLPDDCQSKNGCHTSWSIKEHFGVEE